MCCAGRGCRSINPATSPSRDLLTPITETEKMLAGELYACMDESLVNGRTFARVCMQKLNESSPLDTELRYRIGSLNS